MFDFEQDDAELPLEAQLSSPAHQRCATSSLLCTVCHCQGPLWPSKADRQLVRARVSKARVHTCMRVRGHVHLCTSFQVQASRGYRAASPRASLSPTAVQHELLTRRRCSLEPIACGVLVQGLRRLVNPQSTRLRLLHISTELPAAPRCGLRAPASSCWGPSQWRSSPLRRITQFRCLRRWS